MTHNEWHREFYEARLATIARHAHLARNLAMDLGLEDESYEFAWIEATAGQLLQDSVNGTTGASKRRQIRLRQLYDL